MDLLHQQAQEKEAAILEQEASMKTDVETEQGPLRQTGQRKWC